MQRFLNALELAQGGTASPGLRVVTQALLEAIDETEAEGRDPAQDPAVLVIGAFVAFHTHNDVNTVKGFNRLIDMCRDNLSNGVVA